HSVAVSPAMAHFHQPLGGSDDDLCRHVRRLVPRNTHGASMGRIFYLSIFSQSTRPFMGEFSFTAGMGRFCHQHIPDHFVGLLVSGHDSGFSDSAWPRYGWDQEICFSPAEPGLEWLTAYVVPL